MQTHPPPIQGALEKVAWVIRHLIQSIVTITCCNRIHPGPANKINDRLQAFLWRIERLIPRLAAGTYKPRPKTGPRKSPAKRTPKPPDTPRKKRNWLGLLLLEPHRGSLDRLLREPAMVALIEAAPAETIRPLRSICFMLGLPAPPILALPKRPRPEKPPKAPPPPKPPLARVSFPKPRGSISNRLYRNHRPPGPQKSA
jgi:hypothetical protein